MRVLTRRVRDHLAQARLEEVAHRAIGRVHRQQDAVEQGKPHRAGVDGGHGLACAGGRTALIVQEQALGAVAGRQATEHQQVIP
ncbi:MAG: hypothetical protein HYX44_10075 [Aquabacterium sp.]|nr:hypothetical protein [Aquabacterium sp.]